jgi:hypothetical protein
MKLHDYQETSDGDRLVLLEFNDHAMLAKVLGSEKTYFISKLVNGPGYYDIQSNRHLNTEKYLAGDDQWQKAGKFVVGSEEARKLFKEMSDPDALAGRAKDKSYGG